MKVGVTLPQFRDDAGPALDTARRAEANGLDGVFVFDHLWPLGQPERPALAGFPLAAALAVETEAVAIGTLVARVGVLPDAVLVHTLLTLARIAGSRLIAGLGVGDAMSRAENAAYGAPFLRRDLRLASLREVSHRLRERGVTTWVGGASASIAAVARDEADGLNLWDVALDGLERAAAALPPDVAVTWAGQVDLAADGVDLERLLRAVAATGATWAVVAPIRVPWPAAVESVAAAAASLVD